MEIIMDGGAGGGSVSRLMKFAFPDLITCNLIQPEMTFYFLTVCFMFLAAYHLGQKQVCRCVHTAEALPILSIPPIVLL